MAALDGFAPAFGISQISLNQFKIFFGIGQTKQLFILILFRQRPDGPSHIMPSLQQILDNPRGQIASGSGHQYWPLLHHSHLHKFNTFIKFFDQMQPDIVQSLNNLHITQNQRNYFFIYQCEDWPRVKPHLIKISQKKFQLKHIASYITHNAKKYSSEYKQQPLQALFKYKDSNLENLFACMALAILEFEQTFRAKNVKMPILRRQSSIEWSYTKKEIIVLLSLMSFCLTLQQGEGKTLPRSYNFAVVFGKEVVKTRTLFLYLEEEIGKDSHQIVTIRRYAESHTLNSLTLMQATELLSEVVIHDGGIEDFYGAIKVDFANKFIGGGVLRHGKVQEEIMFINRPEMYISTLFCQCMDSNQAIVFIGFKKYFKQKGYADNVQYDGVQTHKYQFDQKNRANQYIVAIDAIPKPKDQWSQLPMLRQINKALAGFKAIDTCKDVATGNWGCGAFGGDVQLKFLLQWISCSMVGMRYCYCPFKNKKLAAVNRVVKKLKGKAVGELFGTLLELPEGKGVFDHIEDYFK